MRARVIAGVFKETHEIEMEKTEQERDKLLQQIESLKKELETTKTKRRKARPAFEPAAAADE